MKHKAILIFLALFLVISAYSRPARRGIISLWQPDGSTLNAILKGDEFFKLTTTIDGNAIVQEEDGWWCYAVFDNDGNRSSSGWKVGKEVPAAILSESRQIPYTILSAAAKDRRRVMASAHSRIPSLLNPATRTGITEDRHGIVILAEFSDVRLEHGIQDFSDMLTKDGYSRNGADGSAKEYFEEQFGGRINFNFEVSEIVTLPGKRADYGANLPDGQDKDPVRMVIEACNAVDENIDFSMFDNDNDGEIDNVFIFFAGGDEADGAGDDCIWSHSWSIREGAGENIILDGKKLNQYACTSELSMLAGSTLGKKGVLTGIGTFCHEYSHTLGLPDLYDTDYDGSGGEAAGVWIWTSLMDGGNQNNFGNTPPYYNAIEREILGLNESVRIKANGTYALGPIDKTNTFYRLDTDNENEYYLIECRSGNGWDKYIDGRGMLIYHIDRSDRASGYSEVYGTYLKASERWDPANEINCRPDHQCADLIEADGRKDGFYGYDSYEFRSLYKDISQVFFPQPGVTYIAPETLKFWSGDIGTVAISDIRWNEDVIEFRVSGIPGSPDLPEVAGIEVESFTDAAIIQFESDRLFTGNAVVEWGRAGTETESSVVKAYEPGKFAILIEGLEPDNKTYNVSICFEEDGARGKSKMTSFMTRRSPAVSWPYIYMNGVEKNNDGTVPHGCLLPLRLCNAADAAEIIWTYNGRKISTGGNQYYSVTESGTLVARIIWEDGSEDVVMKEIKLGKEE